ncbi:proteasome activator complex subunit 3 isoform X2 [Macrosteles quadrilineatus]|uniref:proteasome activator complex subunit 3 isoform X2 n=1 Tax=Macrosteles quadrilineatus TaxID=74068 RepID=UPI0023E1C9C9|nr:proteasome activator complex subunit 3 isoform X2 [Macrosteles quadrilineatus]
MADKAATDKTYKDNLLTKAEELILKGFPAKILQLNQLLETPQFNQKDMNKVHQDLNIPVPEPITLNNSHMEPVSKKAKLELNCVNDVGGTKVFALPNGTVPSNQTLSELIHTVKPHIKQLVEDTNLLKMWISFLIPKIEDGNNFGVSVQEDTLAEIQSVESEAAAFFDQISRYYASRAKVISKVAKYPHIEDYRRAVKELDEKEYLSLWLVMCEIRNRYCTLHDIVLKNIEKLKKPRSCNSESLY